MFARSVIAAALLAVTSLSQAGPVASENFSYAAGSALQGANGGTGWATGSAWTATGNMGIAQTVLPGDSPMAGTALQVAPRTGGDGSASRTLGTTIDAGRVLVEFVFQFDRGTPGTNDFLALWFGSSTDANIGLKVNCGDGSCPAGRPSADLFVRTSGSSDNDYAAYTTNIAVGTSYTLLGLLEKTGSSAVYNQYSLWVNPTTQERETLTGADAVAIGASTLSSFSTVGFRSVNLSGNDRLLVDNLRIGVVPEPTSLALVGLALLGLGAAARRKRG